MAYTVPVFNLFADVWFDGHTPAVDDPDVENLAVQKYLYARGVWDIQPCEMEVYVPPIYLRIPFTESATWQSSQIFECPAESGKYYRARFKEVFHEGFPNQYLAAIVVQCNAEGLPLIRDIEGAEPCSPFDGELDAELLAEFDSMVSGEFTHGGSVPPIDTIGFCPFTIIAQPGDCVFQRLL